MPVKPAITLSCGWPLGDAPVSCGSDPIHAADQANAVNLALRAGFTQVTTPAGVDYLCRQHKGFRPVLHG